MAKKAFQPVANPGPGASVFLDAVAPKINARWCEWTVVGFGIWRGACGASGSSVKEPPMQCRKCRKLIKKVEEFKYEHR